MRPCLLLHGLVLVLACGSTGSTTESTSSESSSEPPGGTVQGRWFVPTGSPPPQACSVAEDCLGDTIPDAEQPCCNDPRSLRAYARAYRDAVGQWRTEHCEDVTCPPPPAPDMPPDCNFEMRCVEGQCANTCE